MARNRGQKPEISGGSFSSDDLLKQAWESMGRTETGDRIEERESPSSKLASAATTQRAPTETAEEIAEMLRQEAERREQSQSRSRERQQQRRQPPPPQRPSQERPRRSAPTQAPPPLSPAPSQAPPPRPRPQTQPQQEAPRSRRGAGWIAVALFFVISSIIGAFFGDETGSGNGVEIDIPEVTIDFDDLTSTTISPTPGGTRVNIRDVAVGQCIESLPAGSLVDEVTVVPCDVPHQYELFANTIVEADEFPGDEVFSLAADACIPLFGDYVGEDYIDSVYYIDPISPTAEGWKSGDRAVNCLLYLWPDGAEDAEMVTGSARNTGNARG